MQQYFSHQQTNFSAVKLKDLQLTTVFTGNILNGDIILCMLIHILMHLNSIKEK